MLSDNEQGVADYYFIHEAVAQAELGVALKHGGPFGCVITNNNNEIVGVGHNRVIIDNDPTAHGEIVAIRDACKSLETVDLSDCTLYTTSYPCPMCLGAILWARISRVVYGCSIQDAKELGFDDELFYQKFKYKDAQVDMDQINREECIELFEKYNSTEHQMY